MKFKAIFRKSVIYFISFACLSILFGYIYSSLMLDDNPMHLYLIVISSFIILILVNEHLERSTYQNQIAAAISQFRHSHELIIESLKHKTVSHSVKNAPYTDNDDILAEIQILGNLIEKVLHEHEIQDLSDTDTPSAPAKFSFNNLDLLNTSTQVSEEIQDKSTIHAAKTLLSIIKEALQEDRIEMLLQPIVSLPQRKLRFFECFSRIRTPDNTIINPDDFLKIAEDHSLIQTVDNMMLFRCIQLIRKTLRKNFNIRFFINLSSLTLVSSFFRDNFTEFMRDNMSIAPNFVFEIDYETLFHADDKILNALEELKKLGCGFSIDQLPSIEVDFKKFVQLNVKFIKIDAIILQNILKQDTSGLAIHKFKSSLDKAGCDLIITKVEDEQILINLLDFHLDFGQGYLFGAPQLAPVHT